MIITEQKTMKEISNLLKSYEKVAILGCGGCAAYYETGGRKQVKELAGRLRKVVASGVIPRQCSIDSVKEKLPEGIEKADAIVSMACGVGAQTLAEILKDRVVIPALNTKFIGRKEENVYYELCIACGDCILHTTGGICPIARCPKSDLNGPCGGVNDGKCETDKERDCVWILIYNKLRSIGQLEFMRNIKPPKDFSKRTHPRKLEVG